MPSISKLLIPKSLHPKSLPVSQMPSIANTTSHHVTHITRTSIIQYLRCSTNPEQTRHLHGLAVVRGLLHKDYSLVLGAQLVATLVNVGCLQCAHKLFVNMPQRNVFAWNAIIRGYINVGRFEMALDAYRLMVGEGLSADDFTYPLLLKACSELRALEEGRKIVELVENEQLKLGARPNMFTLCAAIDMFAKCGSLGEARTVFDRMPVRDLVCWSAMICGTTQAGEWQEALCLFHRMRLDGLNVDSVIVASILPACGRSGNLIFGMGLHCCAIKSGFSYDLCFLNALIDMYCKCQHVDLGYLLFLGMKERDVVSWSSIISGYLQSGEYAKGMSLFQDMIQSEISPNSVTIVSILPCLSNLKHLDAGKELHCYATRHGFLFDAFVASALIDFYCQCGLVMKAQDIFDIIPDKDIAVWNSLISGFSLEHDAYSAFRLIREVQEQSIKLNSVTIITVLPLCAKFSMLTEGKELHGYSMRHGLFSATSVANSLIDMYCKCGCLNLALKVFEQMTVRDIITYNSIIAAVGKHGNGDMAIQYFDRMKKDGIKPDELTFISILSACSHAGLIDKGISFYHSMINEYDILPRMEHFSCIVDLYGRSGHLDEAWEFIQRMPIEPDVDVLGSLLAACGVHKRADLAGIVGEQILEKNPQDPGNYILLSNIYATCGRWEDGRMIRGMVAERGLIKKPGTSSV